MDTSNFFATFRDRKLGDGNDDMPNIWGSILVYFSWHLAENQSHTSPGDANAATGLTCVDQSVIDIFIDDNNVMCCSSSAGARCGIIM